MAEEKPRISIHNAITLSQYSYSRLTRPEFRKLFDLRRERDGLTLDSNRLQAHLAEQAHLRAKIASNPGTFVTKKDARKFFQGKIADYLFKAAARKGVSKFTLYASKRDKSVAYFHKEELLRFLREHHPIALKRPVKIAEQPDAILSDPSLRTEHDEIVNLVDELAKLHTTGVFDRSLQEKITGRIVKLERKLAHSGQGSKALETLKQRYQGVVNAETVRTVWRMEPT